MFKILSIYLIYLFIVYLPCSAQVYENDAAAREKHFIYQVKQIDEFFERFNDDSGSFIRRVYKEKGIKFRVKRPELIRSLFNFVSHSWSPNLLDSFVSNALLVELPSGKNYYGEDWFAEANCQFSYKGSVVNIPLLLKISTNERRQSKWLITGVRQNFLNIEGNVTVAENSMDKKYFINPASNGNYFIELERVFAEKEHLSSYFDSMIFKSKQGLGFYSAVLEDHIQFLHVKDIRYHFLQVNGFIFTVENFYRDNLNSGWLISNLIHSTPLEKEDYVIKLLGK